MTSAILMLICERSKTQINILGHGFLSLYKETTEGVNKKDAIISCHPPIEKYKT